MMIEEYVGGLVRTEPTAGVVLFLAARGWTVKENVGHFLCWHNVLERPKRPAEVERKSLKLRWSWLVEESIVSNLGSKKVVDEIRRKFSNTFMNEKSYNVTVSVIVVLLLDSSLGYSWELLSHPSKVKGWASDKPNMPTATCPAGL